MNPCDQPKLRRSPFSFRNNRPDRGLRAQGFAGGGMGSVKGDGAEHEDNMNPKRGVVKLFILGRAAPGNP